MAIYNITITDPQEIDRLEKLLKELGTARVKKSAGNPAEVVSASGLQQRLDKAFAQIDAGKTVANEDVVEYIRQLKGINGQK